MVPFRRICCHSCGSRSPHSKGSGIRQFECAECSALNFLDERGNTADPPPEFFSSTPIPRATTPSLAGPREDITSLRLRSQRQQTEQVFCDRCIQNQQMVARIIADRLPDEDHPNYAEFEKGLPEFQKKLEKSHPPLCGVCAKRAQSRLYAADYEGLTRNATLAKMRKQGRDGRRQRDSWSKWAVRRFFSLIQLNLFVGVLVQVLWHAYGIVGISLHGEPLVRWTDEDLSYAPQPSACFELAKERCFNAVCHQVFKNDVWRALICTICLLWYNPGLSSWYHPSDRIEAVEGQGTYFRVQVLILVSRGIAYYYLSDESWIANVSVSRLLAAHFSAIVVILLGGYAGGRAIKVVPWRMKYNKATPRPEDENIFASVTRDNADTARMEGPFSSPNSLFRREVQVPFPISSLAPTRKRNPNGVLLQQSPSARITLPSPPSSESTDEEGDAMDIDWQPSTNSSSRQQQVRSSQTYGMQPPSGWGPLRDETFRLQDDIRNQAEKQRHEQERRARLRFEPPVNPSPFRGRLPQAPMSLERRARNPPSQFNFKQAPESQRQDFMAKLRPSNLGGLNLGTKSAGNRAEETLQSTHGDDSDVDMTPAKNRTKGHLDLKPSAWHLQSDYDSGTGLEDMFTGSFTISDEPQVAGGFDQQGQSQASVQMRGGYRKFAFAVGVLIAVSAIAWQIQEVRRPVALWLLQRLQDAGV
ncbi:hypothetical protein K431DRAFT_231270 [Polychaeton citri CBS 116435]|uniref:Ima1 N-terminal domain-containing protein n=1 Tax=Polychaeton citri CBS 116435 TaxID=1314669 RepID=A0A9P4Q2K9_9PEZI|nr:hypothetical protein K431DRAFT_231270 [Polychaeton citri CBS 116435]